MGAVNPIPTNIHIYTCSIGTYIAIPNMLASPQVSIGKLRYGRQSTSHGLASDETRVTQNHSIYIQSNQGWGILYASSPDYI